MRAGARALGLVAVMLASVGCTSAPAVLRALARDPSSACIAVGSVYGSVVVGRAQQPGARVQVAGGQCSIEHGATGVVER